MTRSIKIMGLCLVAAFVTSAVAVAAASATGGPLWIVGSGGTSLASGETRTANTVNVGSFELKGAANVVCTSVTSTGKLIGGVPGTDEAKIIFSGCALAGHSGCTAKGVKPLAATNAGEVIVDVLTVLAFPEGVRSSALDAYAAQGETGNPNLFVQFKLEGTLAECGALRNQEVKVEAKGTSIKINGVERNCGVLSQIGTGTSGFSLSTSGALALTGLQNFPSPALTKAELWNGAAFEKIECKLEALNKPAEEVGLSKTELSPSEVFGWSEA